MTGPCQTKRELREMKEQSAIGKKRIYCIIILNMPMQQNACLQKQTQRAHTVPEELTQVHAHACPPSLTATKTISP